MVEILSKNWDNGVWALIVSVVLPDGTRQGSQWLEGPEDWTDEDISEAVLALYS